MSAATKSANPGKDVIYIDVDDEITGIIDKVRRSGQKIVALVLPKRAAVFQSIVNMKLLKRAAEEAQKNIVLITSEVGLLPLAGSVGVHVAKTLQTKPEIPDDPNHAADDQPLASAEEPDGEETEMDNVNAIDKTRSIGELAASSALADDLDDTIEMDDEDQPDEDPVAGDAGSTNPDKPTKLKNKKLAVPNFNRFRMLVLLGIPLVVAIIVGLYICLAVLPKASVDIKTDSQAVSTSAVLSLKSANGAKFDLASATLPATQQSIQKTPSQQVNTTGQQNNGQKATGSVSMAAGSCSANVPQDVPAGTGIVSAGNLTFITQTSTSFVPTVSHGKCTYQASGSTGITAQVGGSQYNIAPTTFTISGRPEVTVSSGAATAGGTDDITKIVTQNDIDSASQKIGSQDTTVIKQELVSDLTAKNLIPIEETFNAGSPQTKTSANVGDAAETVTVTQTITYTMLGVSQTDLQKIVAGDVNKKIDTKKQSILDYGLTSAVFGLQSQNPDGASVTFQTTAIAGSVLNVPQIKTQIAGKKGGDASALIKRNPGVTDVTVSYSPFWVSSIPTKTSKITVTVEKPKITKHESINP